MTVQPLTTGGAARVFLRAPRCGAIAGALLVFAASLRAQCPDGSPPPCTRHAPPAANSVAILYFDNLSSDSDAVLADGLTEEIIVRLRRLERLDVKPRSAVLRFRGRSVASGAAAGVLAVANLVSGQVRRVGTRVRVTAELVRVQGEQLLWSTSYVRPVSDAFDLSAEIAESVATAVNGRLLPSERAQVVTRATRNDAAYRHFVEGNAFLARRSPSGIRRAVEEYQGAIAADTRFAAAYARLSLALTLSVWWQYSVEGQSPASVVIAARRAGDQAVRLDSMSSEAWLAMAFVHLFEEPLDPAGTRDAFERSLRINPANAEALHQYAGRLFEWRRPEALAMERRSLALDPTQPSTLNNVAWMLVHDGDLNGALTMIDSVVSVEPDYPMGRFYRAMVRTARGDTAGAVADFAAVERQWSGEWMAVAAAAYGALLRGDTAAAVSGARAWGALVAPWYPYGIGGFVYVGPDDLWLALGRRTEAMDDWEHEPASIKRYWRMRDAAARDSALAADPRFQRLLAGTTPPLEYR